MPLKMSWESSCYGKVPPDAVPAGWSTDTDEPLYVGRAFVQGDTVPGRISKTYKCLFTTYDGEEQTHSQYEVLINPDHEDLTWIPMCNGNVPHNAIEGGRSKDGEALYIGLVELAGITPGKIQPSKKSMFAGLDGEEHKFEEYKVLVSKQRR